MTTNFDYYELAHPSEGVGAGFSYRSVPKVSPRTLGYDEPPNKTVLYDQPTSTAPKHASPGRSRWRRCPRRR